MRPVCVPRSKRCLSPYSIMVIPEANASAAEECLERLKKDYPERQLDVKAASTLEEVFDSRRIAVRTDLTLGQRAGKTFRRYRRPIATTAVLLPLFAFLVWFIFGIDRDVNPWDVKPDHNFFKVRNRNGKELWSVMIGTKEQPNMMKDVYGLVTGPAGNSEFRFCDVVDLDGDSMSEVLVVRDSPPIRGFSDHLSCYRHDGSLAWKASFGDPIVTREGDYSTSIIRSNAVRSGRLDNTGEYRIVTKSSNGFYTDYISVFDAAGSVVGRFLNLGSITTLNFQRDSDGRQCILASATHNGFHLPVVMMFDLRHVDGVCPMEFTHEVLSPRFPPGTEKYYVMLPLSELEPHNSNLTNRFCSVMTLGEIITVEVYECVMPRNLDPNGRLSYLSYTFDPEMRLLDIKTSSEFDLLYEFLHVEGKIRRSKQEILDDLKRNIQYWDGDRFVKRHTVNRRYAEAVGLRAGNTVKP